MKIILYCHYLGVTKFENSHLIDFILFFIRSKVEQMHHHTVICHGEGLLVKALFKRNESHRQSNFPRYSML